MKYKILAGLTVILGIVALLIGNPMKGETTQTSAMAANLISESKTAEISTYQVADWIIANKPNIRIIDLSDAETYAKYRLPKAENIALGEISRDYFFDGDYVILYAVDDDESARAWLKLKNQGLNSAFILYGGVEKWKNEILFPHFPPAKDPKTRNEYAKKASMSLYFGGKPSGIEPGAASAPLQKPAPRPAEAAPVKMPAKKKPSGGC